MENKIKTFLIKSKSFGGNFDDIKIMHKFNYPIFNPYRLFIFLPKAIYSKDLENKSLLLKDETEGVYLKNSGISYPEENEFRIPPEYFAGKKNPIELNKKKYRHRISFSYYGFNFKQLKLKELK